MGDFYFVSDEINEFFEGVGDSTLAISSSVVEFVTYAANEISTSTQYTNDSDEYEVGRIDFKNMFDEKIIDICQKMFNNEKCKSHHYNQMNDFLNTCIIFNERILDLISKLNDLINENSNYFCNHELAENIKSYFEKFKCNCEKIPFFHKKKHNIMINEYLLNDLYDVLNNYLKSTYYEKDFHNTETIYSDIQITWMFIKCNLLKYQKLRNNEYQRIMFHNQNRLEYSKESYWIKQITNFFFPINEDTVTVKQEPELPIIENKIIWKGKKIIFKHPIENNVNLLITN